MNSSGARNLTGETDCNLSLKYRVFINAIEDYSELRKQLLGHFVVRDGRHLRLSWGFYDLRIDEVRAQQMLRTAADKKLQGDKLLQVVTSTFPLEALARWIISQKQITARDVKTLITLNDSLRRYWTQYNWIPTAVAAAAFFILSELPHGLVKELLPDTYLLYSKIVLGLSIGIVVIAVLCLLAMFPITIFGGASLMFDQIEVLLKTCSLIVGDPPNEMVLPASS